MRRCAGVDLLAAIRADLAPWATAEGISREGKALQCDATQLGERSESQPWRAEHDCSLYRLVLEVHGVDSASVQWFFPPANPGSQNAWIGLFKADHVVWGDERGDVGCGGHKLAWRCGGVAMAGAVGCELSSPART